MAEEWLVNSDFTKAEFLKHVESLYKDKKHITFTIRTGDKRTNLQNRSMHKYFSLLASQLNEHGFDMQLVLSQDISVPWTAALVKELIWRPVQLAKTEESSTAKQARASYSEIYDVINRYIGERFGVYVPWPSKETMGDNNNHG